MLEKKKLNIFNPTGKRKVKKQNKKNPDLLVIEVYNVQSCSTLPVFMPLFH